MRSSPQVIGAAHDAVAYARTQVETELNGVGDNPIFLTDEGADADRRQLPGHARGAADGDGRRGRDDGLRPLRAAAQPADEPRAQRRACRPSSPRAPGCSPGMMLSQYTADTLIVEQKLLAAPAVIQSIPAAGDQEDFVSMGMNTAIKNGQILDNAYGVLGIELMAAAQALDFRDFAFGRGVETARAGRSAAHVAHLDEDRPLHVDHTAMQRLVRSGEILDEVEAVVGPLG